MKWASQVLCSCELQYIYLHSLLNVRVLWTSTWCTPSQQNTRIRIRAALVVLHVVCKHWFLECLAIKSRKTNAFNNALFCCKKSNRKSVNVLYMTFGIKSNDDYTLIGIGDVETGSSQSHLNSIKKKTGNTKTRFLSIQMLQTVVCRSIPWVSVMFRSLDHIVDMELEYWIIELQ